MGDAAQQREGSGSADVMKWLADGCEAGVLVRCRLDVVEAKDRDVFGNSKTVLADGAHGPDSCKVVKGDDGRKGFFAGEQLACGRITELWGRHVERDGEGKLGVYRNAELDGDGEDLIMRIL